jgi:hypothetical protein
MNRWHEISAVAVERRVKVHQVYAAIRKPGAQERAVIAAVERVLAGRVGHCSDNSLNPTMKTTKKRRWAFFNARHHRITFIVFLPLYHNRASFLSIAITATATATTTATTRTTTTTTTSVGFAVLSLRNAQISSTDFLTIRQSNNTSQIIGINLYEPKPP